MRKGIFTMILLLLALPISKLAAQHKKAKGRAIQRYMPTNDPNLNPNWDWTVNGPGHRVYYRTPFNGIQSQMVQVPFYTNGHPLNTVVEKDMYPEDGWVLAFRDFGTSTSAPDLPFFGLYNRYRGKLRLMFYNTRALTYNNFEISLRFKSTSHTGALMTFTDAEKPFRQEFDKNKQEVIMTSANAVNGWIWADFTLFGYDPNLNPSTQLRVNITGINMSNVRLESTEFTLNEVLKDASPGGSKKSGTDLLGAANKGYKYYKGANKALKGLKDAVKKQDSAGKNPWWKSIVKPFTSSSTISTVVPIVGSVVGFVSAFLGGKNKAAQREPLNFEGSLKMEGTITTSPQPLYTIDLGLRHATGPNPADFYRVLRPITWGVFNVRVRPVLAEGRAYYCDFDNYDRDCYPCQLEGYEYRLRDNILYDFNTSAGMTIRSIKAAYVFEDKKPSAYYSFSAMRNIRVSTQRRKKLKGIAIELILRTNSPTRNDDREVVMYKVVPYRTVRGPNSYFGEERCFPRGARLAQLGEGLAPELGAPYPNPANAMVYLATGLPLASQARVAIYNATGALVAELDPETALSPGTEQILWDLTDRQGQRVPNGPYFYKIWANRSEKTGTIIVGD